MTIKPVTEVILIACAIAFCLCLVLGLVALCLRLFTEWQPRDAKVFNWLVNGFLLSIVGGIGSLVIQNFAPAAVDSRPNPGPMPGAAQKAPEPASSPSSPEYRTDQRRGAREQAESTGTDTRAIERQSFPEEVVLWGEEHLEPRPFLDRGPGETYPDCVADLRAADVDSSNKVNDSTREKAAKCYDFVQDYNKQVLVPFAERRKVYLTDIEKKMAREKNVDRYQFMRAEFANFSSGRDDHYYQDLDHLFVCDNHLMINLKDYSLMKERDHCPPILGSGISVPS